MIGRTATEKTRTAVRLLLNEAAAWRDGRCSVRIGRAEHRDDRQANCRSNVHRAGIIADEEMALRQEGSQISNRGFPREIDGSPADFGANGRRSPCFGGSSEEDNV